MESVHKHAMVHQLLRDVHVDFRSCQKSSEKDITSPMKLVFELSAKVSEQQSQGEDINWVKVASNISRVRKFIYIIGFFTPGMF